MLFDFIIIQHSFFSAFFNADNIVHRNFNFYKKNVWILKCNINTYSKGEHEIASEILSVIDFLKKIIFIVLK